MKPCISLTIGDCPLSYSTVLCPALAQDLTTNTVPDFLESQVWEKHREAMPGGGTDDKPAEVGDTGTAKGLQSKDRLSEAG